MLRVTCVILFDFLVRCPVCLLHLSITATCCTTIMDTRREFKMKMQTKLVAKEMQNIKVTVPEIRWKNKNFLLFVVVNTNYGIATIT